MIFDKKTFCCWFVLCLMALIILPTVPSLAIEIPWHKIGTAALREPDNDKSSIPCANSTTGNILWLFGSNEKFESGPGLNAEAGFSLSKEIYVGLGMFYVQSQIGNKIRLVNVGNPPAYTYTARTWSFCPYLDIRYYFSRIMADYYVGISQVICFGELSGKAEEIYSTPTVTKWENHYFSDGVGVIYSVEISKRALNYFAGGIRLGYRYLETDVLEDYFGGASSFSGSSQAGSLDFTGPFISITTPIRRF